MIQISLHNGLGRTIYDVSVDDDGTFNAACLPATIVSAGVDTPVRFNCTFTSRMTAGDTKKFKLVATYRKTPTGFVQTSLGEVYGTVQS
jgi:hypothetical protein